MRSNGGWTPLMNAASKGHLPVVLYLLTKQNADPFVRNNWGETAYDVAAAVFEVWICEVLQKAEIENWRNRHIPYNPLSVHTTVPLVLYENQRLDLRFKTLAVSGGRPRFSASGLGRRGRRAPFELRFPIPEHSTGKKEVAAWRSDVQLPLREDPWTVPRPGSSREGTERSHFWLSDWTLDVTHPGVDADDGWQYAHSFDDPDEAWTAELPPQLERLLDGNGAVSAGFGGSRSRSGSAASSSSRSPSNSSGSQNWVRRRRWVRVMRRRLDIPPLPFLQPDGQLYHLTAEGTLIPYVENDDDNFSDGDGQELSSMPRSGLSGQDYVARARYLAGTQYSDSDSPNGTQSALDARRSIAKLERATSELRQGILGDMDIERKTQAEVLLNAYSRELDRRRLAAGAQGLFSAGDDDEDYEDDDSDEEFHYPGSEVPDTTRAPSIRSTTTYFRRIGSRGPTDLTPHLAQAPDFRVPTHEAPQKVLTPRWTPPTPHQVHAQWERDDAVGECRECRRRFTFLNRRHHCRRCGRIFCDRCSSWRALLDPSDVVHDPADAEVLHTPALQRVCQVCYEQTTAVVPSGLHPTRTTSMERIVIDQARLSTPSPSRAQSSSQLSDLAECPVCNTNLADLGAASNQEAHVKHCLEGGSGTTPQTAKYLVYKLPAESALIGIECAICLEEFVAGSTVARLSCLCSFHNACLSSWLQRGRSCPIHAR
ncbi:FYVE-domain-containing protein [Rhodofomes roseus]|uniref:RING-type E3 ubiquitin transferase n=1 Tax=Rhodofomes roseus TaxID=34475 RepID=A0ABQ8KXE5_9APHY|nr:FYVE-domain-containing protein [Rhodofomes roseus]KAH9843911.1 FYVE-domain-containing protein [Rhodofomes roseus]